MPHGGVRRRGIRSGNCGHRLRRFRRSIGTICSPLADRWLRSGPTPMKAAHGRKLLTKPLPLPVGKKNQCERERCCAKPSPEHSEEMLVSGRSDHQRDHKASHDCEQAVADETHDVKVSAPLVGLCRSRFGCAGEDRRAPRPPRLPRRLRGLPRRAGPCAGRRDAPSSRARTTAKPHRSSPPAAGSRRCSR
jgi:hypothetical protein